MAITLKTMGLALLLPFSLYAADLKGYFITHVGDSGRQSIVEFFERDGKYYAYGFANIDGSGPKKDSKNQNPALRERVDKGSIFVYNLNKKGEQYNGGLIYNYDDGKEYYLKANFKDDNTLELRASVDKMGFMGATLIWKRLNKEQEKKYLPEKPDFSVVEQSLKTLQATQ